MLNAQVANEMFRIGTQVWVCFLVKKLCDVGKPDIAILQDALQSQRQIGIKTSIEIDGIAALETQSALVATGVKISYQVRLSV